MAYSINKAQIRKGAFRIILGAVFLNLLLLLACYQAPETVHPDDVRREKQKYFALVEKRIHQKWYWTPKPNPDPEPWRDRGYMQKKPKPIFEMSPRALLKIHISEKGEVLKAVIERSTGNPDFDRSVLRAAKKASPLPAPPPNLYQRTKFLRFWFDSVKRK